MSGVRASIRYAKALLSLTSDQNTAEAVNNDMKLIVSTLANSKELGDTLLSPVLPSTVKKSILLEVFKNCNKTTLSLIDLLIANNRIGILSNVASKYNQLFDQSKDIELATVTTAVALTPSLKNKVLEKAKELSGKNIEVKNIIDESILGGFILRIGDLQYNSSIDNQLKKLKKEFTLN